MTNQQRISFVAPGKVIIDDIELSQPGPKQIAVRSICSAISAGSERLVYRGQFPGNTPIDSSFSDQQQNFGYPMSYGYSLVGEITAVGRDLSQAYLGKQVFGFKPHQSYTVCDFRDWTLLPADLDPFDACFLANCETAVNIAMDSQAMIGERVAIIGQGVLGLLTKQVMERFPLDRLIVVDKEPERLQLARMNSDVLAMLPEELGDFYHSCDLVIELSGQLSALQTAIALCRYGARIVVASWYGENQQPLALNTHFHRMRLSLVSSQVSTINPTFSGRYDSDRRMSIALQELQRARPSKWISHRVRFREDLVREAYHCLDKPDSKLLQMVFCYH